MKCSTQGQRQSDCLPGYPALALVSGLVATSLARVWAEQQRLLAEQARDDAEQARDDAHRKAQRARANLDMAREALDAMLTEVAEKQLKDNGEAKARAEFLRQVAAFYEQLAREGADGRKGESGPPKKS